ncbi:hypothetical protein M501DRAFT_1004436 [Patellaria atrata CBS 101060]|uniref:Uncharacterized protein n=1 Tax=Patellaria atrata CBS 101060 TaxID=1346257 RepID=A0A9P4S9M5_9PEZI|nr:hypothetical protein M501DRAFT_1004436 [Patellaria atrata CBS 101060]
MGGKRVEGHFFGLDKKLAHLERVILRGRAMAAIRRLDRTKRYMEKYIVLVRWVDW